MKLDAILKLFGIGPNPKLSLALAILVPLLVLAVGAIVLWYRARKKKKAEAAPAPVSAPAPAAHDGDRVFASPLARRIAKEKGLDLAQIKGSGPKGRIVKADIEGAKPGAAAPAPSAAQAPTRSGTARTTTPQASQRYWRSRARCSRPDRSGDPFSSSHSARKSTAWRARCTMWPIRSRRSTGTSRP